MQRKYSKLEGYEILTCVRALAGQERTLIADLLEYLYEVELRKLYAPLAYSSLHEFGVKELGFTDAQSYERTRAVAAMRKVPEVRDLIRSGEISLTNAAQLNRAIEAEKRALGEEVTNEFKAALVEAASGATKREFQGKLEVILTNPESRAAVREKLTHRSATRTGVQFEIAVTTEAKIKRVRELVDAPTLEELFDLALDALIAVEEKKRKYDSSSDQELYVRGSSASPAKVMGPDPVAGHGAEEEHEPKKKVSSEQSERRTKQLTSRYVPAKYKTEIAKRSGSRCEFIDPLTMRRCASRSHLQIDHKWPLALGGKTTLQNLRHLCGTHNRMEAERAGLGVNIKN